MSDNVAIACQLSSPEKAARLAELRSGLFAHVLDVVENRSGFVFSFQNGAVSQQELFEVIDLERLCCPFLTFELLLPPAPQPITLALTGGADIKALVRETFVALAPVTIV